MGEWGRDHIVRRWVGTKKLPSMSFHDGLPLPTASKAPVDDRYEVFELVDVKGCCAVYRFRAFAYNRSYTQGISLPETGLNRHPFPYQSKHQVQENPHIAPGCSGQYAGSTPRHVNPTSTFCNVSWDSSVRRMSVAISR